MRYRHNSAEALEIFHMGLVTDIEFMTILARLQDNKPEFLSLSVLITLWVLYLASTFGLVLISIRSRNSPVQRRESGFL